MDNDYFTLDAYDLRVINMYRRANGIPRTVSEEVFRVHNATRHLLAAVVYQNLLAIQRRSKYEQKRL